jgi:hypothetical protein
MYESIEKLNEIEKKICKNLMVASISASTTEKDLLNIAFNYRADMPNMIGILREYKDLIIRLKGEYKMQNPKYTKEGLQAMLRSGPHTVTFTKVDGDERVMPCTLVESEIPESAKPKGTAKEPTAKQLENLGVWSLESEGWRSFKIENVTNVEPYILDLHE